GAGDQATILSPAGGDAIRVIASAGITIRDLWLRSTGGDGRGMALIGSSVTTQGIRTDDTQTHGVVAASFRGQSSTLTAISSQLSSVRTGIGLCLQAGSSATIRDCTFNNNGTAPGVTTMSNGLVLEADARADIVNSQFIGNTNSGLVALDGAQVTARGSTFS